MAYNIHFSSRAHAQETSSGHNRNIASGRSLISMIDETTTNNIPIISLTSPGILSPQQMLPSILQMSNDITLQAQCNAAIVGIFKWRKVKAIYENNKDFSADSGLVTLLSDSLRIVNSEVKHHLAFLPLTSLSKPEAAIEEELKKLMTKNNRVLVLLHCSLELAILIFDKAKQMGMIEKGYVWIVSKEIASLLHLLDSSIFDNMQVVNRLPYHLPYVLVPFYGSYDDMVEQIFYKGLDADVGNTNKGRSISVCRIFTTVFPKGSPLLFDILEAILKETETGEINQLEEDMLSSFKCTSSLTGIIDSLSLGPRPFSGLLFVSGGVSGFAFFVAIVRLAKRELRIVNLVHNILINRRVWRLLNSA
ncbi:hypothetical protein EZV62_021638 [Acer yangbiense]|uniref:Receptor ligand binding region domain-containing protein n=1 Tax=Acer yangbiense TaxID=1000413 RepID=A0A5C7H6X0_9ROSI|nr:hypothetical protein EZV62_021638 [Acer yangbiense]